MFNDLFDFAKKRTIKESVGFFIFHSSIVMAVLFVVQAMGVGA